MENKLICTYCKEETTTDKTSQKWNISKENEKPVCFECDWKFFQQENYNLYSEYGPEEIAEDNERIKRNNRDYEEDKYSKEEYNPYKLEVETLPTLGLSLSSGGKKILT